MTSAAGARFTTQKLSLLQQQDNNNIEKKFTNITNFNFLSLDLPDLERITLLELLTKYDGKKVEPLDAQESYRMHSFARANCFIVAGEETAGYKEGDIVEIHLLPC